MKKGYTFLRWNGEYGKKSQFVVKDNASNKQALFSPGRMADLTWVKEDLSEQYSKWEDFGNETVDNLEDVVF